MHEGHSGHICSLTPGNLDKCPGRACRPGPLHGRTRPAVPHLLDGRRRHRNPEPSHNASGNECGRYGGGRPAPAEEVQDAHHRLVAATEPFQDLSPAPGQFPLIAWFRHQEVARPAAQAKCPEFALAVLAHFEVGPHALLVRRRERPGQKGVQQRLNVSAVLLSARSTQRLSTGWLTHRSLPRACGARLSLPGTAGEPSARRSP
jgi:hypothetical protein